MVKIRLHGTLDEIEKAVAVLQESFEILQESTPYKDKGKSQYYRCYLDCKRKGE